jgi:hypothetical protein
MTDAELAFALSIVVVGVGATAFMDLWNLFLKRAVGVPSLDFCLLGRWIRHMPSGTFWHSSIGAATKKPRECVVGWSAHYMIGLAMAAVFILATGDWIHHPTILPALAFGVATVVLPLFILQPALGLGFASAKVRNPARARVKSLVTHSVFGLGLYLSAHALGYVLRVAA